MLEVFASPVTGAQDRYVYAALRLECRMSNCG